MKIYRTLKQQSLAIAALFIVATLIGLWIFSTWIVVLITAALAQVALTWRLYRALQRQFAEQQFSEFRQMEALTALYNTLDIQQPLPRTRHTAASPDFLYLLASEIFRLQPALIVELGSGTSTLIAAYCLKKIARGRIVSLDHLDKYAGITQQTITSHGLDNHAEVLHAPLKQYEIDGASYRWYDDAVLKQFDSIDLLIVDGPPQDVSKWARYPAIPLLDSKLHTGSVVLLDDGGRPDETAIVAAWAQKYGLDCRNEPTEKGAFSCRREQGQE